MLIKSHTHMEDRKHCSNETKQTIKKYQSISVGYSKLILHKTVYNFCVYPLDQIVMTYDVSIS